MRFRNEIVVLHGNTSERLQCNSMPENHDRQVHQVSMDAAPTRFPTVERAVAFPRVEGIGDCKLPRVSRREFLVQAGASVAMVIGGVSSIRAASKPPVRVGFILPESGPLAGEAHSLISGFELFLKEQGQRAPSLELLKKDPGPDEKKTLEALAALVMNKEVQFLVGPLSLEASEKTVHGVKGGKVVLFVTNPSVRLVAGEMCLPASFRLCANTYQRAHPIAPWAVQNVGLKAFITGSDDWLGNEQADFFASGFERAGGSFVDRMMVSNGAVKMREVVEAVRKGKPDFVFASFRGGQAVAFVEAFRGQPSPLSQPLIGPESLVDFPRTLDRQRKNAVGIKTLSTLKNPQAFTSRIKRKLNRDIADSARAAEGYDIANAICQVVRQTGDETNELSGVIRGLEQLEIDGPRGVVRFDKNHEPILGVVVQEWKFKGSSLDREIVKKLGAVTSPDFGCGRVGFPKRPELESAEEDQPGETEE
jgi:ABC-type branched-subunit amino acid transport system substrate-binding protein